jgi:hypothetical protein
MVVAVVSVVFFQAMFNSMYPEVVENDTQDDVYDISNQRACVDGCDAMQIIKKKDLGTEFNFTHDRACRKYCDGVYG